jgi:hypothetical protein
VRGELGWWRLRTRRHFLMLKYWLGILVMGESRLVKTVYNQSKKEYVFRHKSNWVKDIYKLVQKYGVENLWRDESLVWNIPVQEKSVDAVKKYWTKSLFEKVA